MPDPDGGVPPDPGARVPPDAHAAHAHARVPLALDRRGNALTSFRAGEETDPPRDAPLPAALVALWHGDRVLMVFDRFRQGWELPGGRIDPGESAREAAARELSEETGRTADGELRFAGYAGFLLAPDGRAEYGALYVGRVATGEYAFTPNDEIEAVQWWDPAERPEDPVEGLDACLARLSAQWR